MNENLDKVDDLLLAPWQKFDAINTFVLPCISFLLMNGVLQKKSLADSNREEMKTSETVCCVSEVQEEEGHCVLV
jgi:hypothetical protein